MPADASVDVTDVRNAGTTAIAAQAPAACRWPEEAAHKL
jgi:hypothetical protein